CLLVEDGDTGDVGGQQVGGALQALEGAADAACQGPGQHGLGHAGHVFEQNVPLAEVGDQAQLDLGALADDHLFHVGQDLARGGRHIDGGRGGATLVGGGRFGASLVLGHADTCKEEVGNQPPV